MPENQTDFRKLTVVQCKMTSREYYDFRLEALKYKVQFLVTWEKHCCIVECEATFLTKCGYTHGVDF